MTGRSEQPRPETAEKDIWHASCVAVNGRAALIRGPSGSGKSGLALQLMAYGAMLVADDRTQVWRSGDAIWADVPDRLSGLIEARAIGILRVPPAGPQPVAVIIDMNELETERLPKQHSEAISGLLIPVLRKSELPHFPAAIMTYLRGQREA